MYVRCTVHTDSVVYGREERSERRDKSEKGARKDTMGVVNSVKSFLYFWYLQYTLNTSIYMLEPLEQFLFSILFLQKWIANWFKVMYVQLIYCNEFLNVLSV